MSSCYGLSRTYEIVCGIAIVVSCCAPATSSAFSQIPREQEPTIQLLPGQAALSLEDSLPPHLGATTSTAAAACVGSASSREWLDEEGLSRLMLSLKGDVPLQSLVKALDRRGFHAEEEHAKALTQGRRLTVAIPLREIPGAEMDFAAATALDGARRTLTVSYLVYSIPADPKGFPMILLMAGFRGETEADAGLEIAVPGGQIALDFSDGRLAARPGDKSAESSPFLRALKEVPQDKAWSWGAVKRCFLRYFGIDSVDDYSDLIGNVCDFTGRSPEFVETIFVASHCASCAAAGVVSCVICVAELVSYVSCAAAEITNCVQEGGASPGAPTNLAASQVTDRSAVLSWRRGVGAEKGFGLEYRVGSAGDWAEVPGTIPAGSQNVRVSSLSCGTAYFFRVYAFNDGGRSSFSNTVPATTSSCSATRLSNGQSLSGQSVQKGAWKNYYIDLPTGVSQLSVATSNASGDVDLYVRFGGPASTAAFDCKATSTSGNESCQVSFPQSGRWWVSVFGYSAAAYSLRAEFSLGCMIAINPTSQSFASTGGLGSVAVTASAGSCAWVANSNVSWISITSGGSSVGSGTVTYAVSANTSSSQRAGSLTIAGKTLQVNQSAPSSATLLQDNFSDGQTSGWNLVGGVWTESGGYLRSIGSPPGAHYPALWAGGGNWSNYIVETDIRIETDSCAKATELLVRYQTQANSCQCQLNACGSDKRLYLVCPSGNASVPFPFTLTGWYRMRVTANGSAVACEIVGQPGSLLSLPNSGAPTVGTVGFESIHGPGRFDNLLVTSTP